MTRQYLEAWLSKKLINQEQFDRLLSIANGTVFSVYYELRILLYLGVLLFSSGIGILIYKNIGELGHLVSIGLLGVASIVCFWYMVTKAGEFTTSKTVPPTPYYDYVVLLGSLLFISFQGYLQFKYQLLDENLGWSTLISALLFFFIAYRFDHVGILSLGITALASFFSISLSPQKWYSGEFFESNHLYITSIALGASLVAIAMLLHRKSIKQHFTFTYINFGLLMYFIGAMVGLFDQSNYGIFVLVTLIGSVFAIYYAYHEKSFLFLLYAFVFTYIAITYLLFDFILDDFPELIFYYSIASCGGFVYFIISYKKFFKRES